MIIALIAVAALVVVLCLALLVTRHRFLGAPLPKARGRLDMAGLIAPVTISRDRWGVPHIAAISMEDAAFAIGVAHAQDRLWQMEVTRRVATGRISELIGPDGVNIDRFIRRVGLHRVAREEELALSRVPDRDREHSPQALEGIFAPVSEGREQHLGVASCAKCPSGGFELSLQGSKIVDGAVEDQGVPTVGRRHGLMSVCRVENGQAAHPDRCRPAGGKAGVVRPAMHHCRAHTPDGGLSVS